MIVQKIFTDQFCTMFVNSSGSKLTDITGKWDFKIKYVSGFNNMVIVSHTFRRLLFWIICRLPKKEHKKENKYPNKYKGDLIICYGRDVIGKGRDSHSS